MERIIINGGIPLRGEVSICGAKNSVVGLLPAALLAEEGVCVIENIPGISDVSMMFSILESLGAKVRNINANTVEIDSTNITANVVPYEMSKSLRASYYFLGALLGRFQNAHVAMPGGCDFGTRPIDQHIKSFEALGATIVTDDEMVVHATADKLIGSTVYMDVVSVGATINAMLTAVKAKGLTVIENAAREPHIVDIANFLNAMGANIRGAGTDTIKINGVDKLHGCSYSVVPDQIEAGTYMAAVVATGGKALIKNVTPKHLESIMAKLIECGATIEEYDDSLLISREKPLVRCNVKTMPHPGFPTDMQPQFTALLSVASGVSVVTESVWDNRYRYVEQLINMGAQISVDGSIATVTGVEKLRGTRVGATDLRAGAALIIAGLCAEGTTTIEKIEYIERGYENIVEKFSALGADIKRVSIPDNE
ncbi:MAG: UDP-N-acetylglucosamine 1-carboxyvinyltransferase [Clostridia bacterium]|nr:UDP-N-acetylglucosamine 1-carboxyvinyltransferase [Clostridia bacterium]